jgi:hypothetical protein
VGLSKIGKFPDLARQYREMNLNKDKVGITETIQHLNKTIKRLIENYGFNFTNIPKLNSPADFFDVLSTDKRGADGVRVHQTGIYQFLGLFATDTAEKLPPVNKKFNLMFGDESVSHGINRPFEAVLITKSYENIEDNNDIIQILGRCGRPGLSEISVVYLTERCYRKILTDDENSGILNVATRYKHYLQTPGKRIDEPIDISPNAKTRLSILLEVMQRPANRFL